MNDTISTTRNADPTRTGARPTQLRPHLVRSQIMDYLAVKGASRISDISGSIGSPRASIQYHMLRLETASIVQANIPAGERARFTPYYSLAGKSTM